MCTQSGNNIDNFLTTGIMNDPDMKKYADDVDYYAREGKDFFFGNKGEMHAAIVLAKLIHYSN